jgi:hypothetical protein
MNIDQVKVGDWAYIDGSEIKGEIVNVVRDAPEDGRSYVVVSIPGDSRRHWRYAGEIGVVR